MGLSATPPPPPGSLVVLTCHDDHRKMKGFLLKHDSWNSVPHLMRSGSVVCVMAMWHVLIGGFDAPLVCLLGFLLVFSFSCPVLLNFLSFLFFRHFLFLRHCCSVSSSPSFFSCISPFWDCSFEVRFLPHFFILCREDYLQESLGLFFSILVLGILPLSSLLLGSMVDSSKVSVRTYVFYILRTYVMILCNWLIL